MMMLTGCAQMTTYVDVWHEPDAPGGSLPLTMHLTYSASKLDHPPSYRVTLDENPKRVKFYNAPVLIGVDIGSEPCLRVHLPSARSWGKLRRFDEYMWDDATKSVQPTGVGWVTIEGREMRLHIHIPQDVDRTGGEETTQSRSR
jgi:hypothetical protein